MFVCVSIIIIIYKDRYSYWHRHTQVYGSGIAALPNPPTPETACPSAAQGRVLAGVGGSRSPAVCGGVISSPSVTKQIQYAIRWES